MKTRWRQNLLIHLAMPDGSEDVALIDAATLANDFVGNRMPVDPNNLRQLLVSTARPDTIGVSSVAGLHAVCLSRDDSAILVTWRRWSIDQRSHSTRLISAGSGS